MPYTDLLALDNCIKCSICVTQCPVARVTPKFAGPKQNGPDLERFRLEQPTAVHPSVEYCLNCKNCDVACPSGVNVSAMNCRARGELACNQGISLRDRVLARVELMGKACSLAPWLVNWGGKIMPLRWLGEKIMGLSREMTMPHYAEKTFYRLYSEKDKKPSRERVVYFPGCYVNYNTPEVGMALVEVLGRNGVEVLVDPEFSCCGLPLISNGLLSEAKNYAQKNVMVLQKYLNKGYLVITSCPSCSLTITREYQEILEIDHGEKLIDNVLDIFRYLDILEGRGELDTSFSPLPWKVGYHQPCHLRAAGCGVSSAGIIKLIPGLQVHHLDAGCCGLSGSYGFKEEKYPISMDIGKEVFEAINAQGLDQVISECGMCRLQISHGTGVKTHHPIQLVAASYNNIKKDNRSF